MIAYNPQDIRIVVNIPFCPRKCTYCDFPVCDTSTTGLRSAYMAALNQELDSLLDSLEGRILRSVYITGGTPTTVPPQTLADLITRLRTVCETAPDLEITIDTNPGAIGADALSQFKHAGVNRFDIGLCTTHPLEFETLIRPYGWNDIHFTQMLFEFAAFKNYSLDTLYGLPGQTPNTLRDSLEEGIELSPAPVHMSLYPLRLVPETRFYRCFVEGDTTTGILTNNRVLPTDDERFAMYQRGCKVLEAAGFERYTIYHFARPAYRCLHFELGCSDVDTIGLGLAAQSYFEGILSDNTRDLQIYLDAHGDPERLITRAVMLDDLSRQARFVVAALTATEGLSKKVFEERFGVTFDAVFGVQTEQLADEGLLALSDDADGTGNAVITLTELGTFRAPEVFERLQAR